MLITCFDGVVDTMGVVNYGEDLELRLTGLNPAMRYRVVAYGDRGNPRYTDRLSKTTLLGA